MGSDTAVEDPRTRGRTEPAGRPLADLDHTLSHEQQSAMQRAMSPVQLTPGQVLFEQDDDAASLFVVQIGRLKVSRRTATDRQRIVALLGPGDLFGEMSLFDGSRRDGTVTAVAPTTLLELPQPRFDAWLTEHPELTDLLFGLMGRRLRESNEVVADLVFADVPSRVARLLLKLAERFGSPTIGGGSVLDHGLTQDELAQCVGATRETVNKALALFASRGWIEVHFKRVTVKNHDRLRAMTY